jgi:outer membrane immunogenic protein
MNKLLIATLSIGALTLGAASAADLRTPVKSPAPVAVAPACANFGGGYIGVHGGAAYHDGNWIDNNAWARNEVDLALPDSSRTNKFGYEVGPHVGWNWQSRCTLWGLVADWSWSGTRSSRTHTDGQPGAALDTLDIERRLNWYGTVRAKGGVIVDNVLIYATGGFAYASIKWSAAATNNIAAVFVTETFSATDLRWGGVVGVGAEWAWSNNWSIGTEFLYMRFAEKSATFNSAFAVLNGNPPGKEFTQQDSVLVSRVNLTYRWGGAPVVARY